MSTNILFVGPYRQHDGWGLAARDYIRAISSLPNINLTTRPIYLAPGNTDASFNDEQIISYENNKADKYDYVIQNTLPEYFYYDSRYGKNIGLFILEINNFSKTKVISNINRMDEIWVPSNIEKESLQSSGCIKTIRAISAALNIDIVKTYPRAILNPAIANHFRFYTICENNFRKNLQDLIIAFNLAFDISDPVSLVIKTNGDIKELTTFANQIKQSLHLNKPFKNEVWMTQRISYDDILRIHSSCDCFVMPSYGEAFCRPAAEALCLGKNPIVNKNSGMKDFINNDNGFLVNSHKTPVIMPHHPIAGNTDYYNANQHWYKIDIYDLIKQMQKAYGLYKKDKKAWDEKSNLGISQKESFSYSTIGKKLCIQDSN
jgi:glycosyltransferase involved in cell wall biosynthesis